MFKAVNPKVDIPKLEQEQLDFWRMNRIFQRSMQERENAPRYVTYEGPPTVNGDPGVHHVLARAFKDIFPRYKTMRGFYALRKGGWDTHGLPVEIAIEKELGFKHKHEIEEYGVAAFNEKARHSVLRNIGNWERFTERIAYWTDLDNPYVTFTNDYVESVWWILQAVVGQRAALQRAEGRPVLRALRHAAEQPRGRARLQGRARPQRVRALPAEG